MSSPLAFGVAVVPDVALAFGVAVVPDVAPAPGFARVALDEDPLSLLERLDVLELSRTPRPESSVSGVCFRDCSNSLRFCRILAFSAASSDISLRDSFSRPRSL